MYGVYGSAKEEVHAPRDNSPMPSSSQSPRLPGKGKRKMEEQITAEGRVCGICFAEERRLIRGFIDCCDHYFCFLCIMEWAKIESRCPMCKQRFGSIRRPLVPGVFSGERIFRVPARDQAQIQDHDPYANTSCVICHTSEDEHLLLLCDLCDSSAHTYCSGLGFTVPDGDWYCPDCAVSRIEQSKMKDCDQHSNDHSISICHIIGDEGCSLRRDPEGGERDRGSSIEKGMSLVETVARTLHRQRDRHLRIQLLRENWSNFQRGSMNFRSTSVSLSRHQNSVSEIANSGDRTPQVKTEHSGSTDIDRAWKMLEIAKNSQTVATHQPPKSSGTSSVTASISHRRLLPVHRHPNNRRPSVGIGSSTKMNPSFGLLKNGPHKYIKTETTGFNGCSSSASKSMASSGEAKTEIQSLVKAKLKCKGRHFGKDKFKEVARISTHTILASCGLDHSGSASRAISAPLCRHGDEASFSPSLLHGSCRECFHSFVGHVVEAIISERIVDSVKGSQIS